VTTILVAGGAGYIGSHTAKALRAAGYRTVIYDNLSAGHAEAALGSPVVVGEIVDVPAVRQAIRDHAVTGVLHFAAWVDVGESVTRPLEYYRNNVAGTLGLLEAAVSEGCRHLVFSSTCAVYGDPATTPIDEAYPTVPMSAYGQTKLAIERALPHVERAHDMRSVCLRYFNAAGADPDGELGEDHAPEIHLIPRAIEAAVGGTPLEIFGADYPTPDGTCQRDYVHVTDLADAHVRALRHLEGGGASLTCNLGTGQPSSVQDVIAAVERVTGRVVARRVAGRRPGDPSVLCASAALARTVLDWRPRYPSLDDMVAHAWAWHLAHPSGYTGALR
jgi:UDP-glucose-4-epimerase GalE